MLNENHQNLSCQFAAEIVSYLYDEMMPAEKLHFEDHLKTCSNCPEEISSFSVARASILDWREQEFAPLATPIIEIPFESEIEVVEITPKMRPWFAPIRDLFSLSPAWMTATTAFAALAICVGLVLVTINSLRYDEVVQEDKPKSVPSPTLEISNQNSTVSNSNQATPTPTKSPMPNFNGDSNTKQPSTGTKTPSDSTGVKPQNLKKNASPPINKSLPKSNQKGKLPSLVGDDEEEDTLRLSDLLEEIGDVKK